MSTVIDTIGDLTDAWQMQDAIATVVNACGHEVWNLHSSGGAFVLETGTHLTDEAISSLCAQLPLSADYGGEGTRGTIIIVTP